jgi:hypothetical protein
LDVWIPKQRGKLVFSSAEEAQLQQLLCVQSLGERLITYIRRYNSKAKPFKWTYRSAGRRINPASGLNATPHQFVD